jgi:hypothetical protein
MEHRLAERIASTRAVDLFGGRCSPVRGHIRNISKDGALLEADGPLPYCGHVGFELRATALDTRARRLRGVVIHRDDQKLGVMLLDRWSDAEWNALTRPARALPQG